ncbi:MAG: hypothetical protein M3Q58_07600 [Bacteroidota bacterium]|nr:hypothetical protein [Bacteroidota bacterium]
MNSIFKKDTKIEKVLENSNLKFIKCNGAWTRKEMLNYLQITNSPSTEEQLWEVICYKKKKKLMKLFQNIKRSKLEKIYK